MMLGEQLDTKVKNYVITLQSAGTPIGSSIVMAVGEGIVNAHDRTMLVQHGGHIQITKAWALLLLKRIGYVKRKTTNKTTPGLSGEEIETVRRRFLKQEAQMVKLRDISDKLVINLDQTGIKLVPAGD